MAQRIAMMSGFMVMPPLQRGLLASFEAASGLAVEAEWAPTTLLAERIAGGHRADVLIVTGEAMDGFIADGVIDGATRADFVEMSVGVAVRAGAPRPDISTPEAFRTTLMTAKSIACSRAGASGIYFRSLIQKMGIAEALAPRLVEIPSGLTGELAADGRAELAVQQLSELGGVDGVDIVGGFPPELNKITTVSAGMFGQAASPDGARMFLRFLQSDEAAAAFEASWLSPIRARKGN